MDPVTFEKFQAMKRYKKTKYRQILLQYLVTALVLGVCISKALSFPSSLFSSIKIFFSISLPDNIGGVFVRPKCLFVVCNAIVLFLVWQSMLTGPSSLNSENLYEDYVQHRRRSLVKQPPTAVNHVKENKEKSFVVCMGKRADDEVIGHIRETKEGERVVLQGEKEKGVKERGVEKEDCGEEKEEEENEREVNELNRRIEDFFARVNRQRKLEAETPD
ncbi:hypothetical protein ACLOJK_002096 [Asimina triloba]